MRIDIFLLYTTNNCVNKNLDKHIRPSPPIYWRDSTAMTGFIYRKSYALQHACA